MSLGTKNADYMSLYSALKGNYRKGVHRFRAMLSNPDLADEFSKSVGGVSVVLGWPIGQDDKNSQQLLALLLESPVLTQATLTWLSQWYPDYAEDADTMYGDAGRCQEIRDDPLLWRAANMDPVGAGKLIATLAGLSPVGFDDITALVASDAAMQAVIASPAALEATVSSQTAMTAVAASQTAMTAIANSYVAEAAIWQSSAALQVIQADAEAWATFTGATSAVMGKTAAVLAGLDPAGYADMTAIAASSTAMAAVINNADALAAIVSSSTAMTAVGSSEIARAAVTASAVAMAAICESSMAVAKYATGVAGLDPAGYADMTAVAASSTAMAAVAASYVAEAAIWASPTAVQTIQANNTAWATFTGATSAVMGKTAAVLAGLDPAGYADMAAVAASSTAMTAVAASSTAMTAIYNSSTARSAICASDAAYQVLLARASYVSISGTYSGNNWTSRYNGKCVVLEWCYTYNNGTCGIRRCLDGTAERQYQGAQRYNSSAGSQAINSTSRISGSYFKEMVFCSSLETYNSQGDWPAISVAFFKLP